MARMSAASNRTLGAYGERVAARHLTQAGMVLLDTNWRCDLGEIDLVLRHGEVLVACEVKTRRGLVGGHPLEAVDDAKAQRVRHLLERWMEDHGVTASDTRVDLVGVLRPTRGAAQVLHLRGVA